MTIQSFPFNIPISSSFAVSGSIALSTPQLPVTAAFATYAVNFVGPIGPSGSYATRVTIL